MGTKTKISFKVPEDPFLVLWKEYCNKFSVVMYPYPIASATRKIPTAITLAELMVKNGWTNEENAVSVKTLAKKSKFNFNHVYTAMFLSPYSMQRTNIIFEADSRKYRKKGINNNQKFYFVDPDRVLEYVAYLRKFRGYLNEN